MAIYKANCLILQNVIHISHLTHLDFALTTRSESFVICKLQPSIFFKCFLSQVGAYVEGGMEIDFGHAQKVQMWPRIVWHPGWALTSSDVLKKMLYEKERSSITLASSLVLSAPDIVIENLQLDGTLFVHTVPGVIVSEKSSR